MKFNEFCEGILNEGSFAKNVMEYFEAQTKHARRNKKAIESLANWIEDDRPDEREIYDEVLNTLIKDLKIKEKLAEEMAEEIAMQISGDL